jgi:hypothetical protein
MASDWNEADEFGACARVFEEGRSGSILAEARFEVDRPRHDVEAEIPVAEQSVTAAPAVLRDGGRRSWTPWRGFATV